VMPFRVAADVLTHLLPAERWHEPRDIARPHAQDRRATL
jgi:hypothetical protein